MSARRGVVLAATLAGLGLALAVTLLLPTTYRATGVVVLTREGRAPGDDPTLGPAAAAAAELLESRAVAESAAANLRLDDSADELLDRVEVDTEAQSSLLRLAVEAGGREEARRLAQELAEVFTVLYNTRFGPETTVSTWEAPRAEEDAVSPRHARNLALGALAGALAGLALVSRRRWGAAAGAARPVAGAEPEPPPAAAGRARDTAAAAGVPADERLLATRVAAVTRRELALARRAAELAVRERELVLEQHKLARAAAPAPEAPAEPPAKQGPQPDVRPGPLRARDELVLEQHKPPAPPPPAIEARPEPEPDREPFRVPGPHEWRVADVERLLDEHGDAAEERREELGFYLEPFRDVAGEDGRLPPGVAVVVEDEFAALIERARSRAAGPPG